MTEKPARRRESGRIASNSKTAEIPSIRFRDLGGIESILQQVRELVEYPLAHPEIYAHLGVEPPRGVLLHGPPGSGKSMLAGALAAEMHECGVTYFKISAPEVVSGMSAGESEETIRDLFNSAKAAAPALIFIDEIDAITPKRENAQREMERRIVAQLLTCMDDLGTHASSSDIPKTVIVIGATNRPDALDSALRRAGRFDREICMGVPDEPARLSILRVLTSRLRLSGDFNLEEIARRTPGYVGADLAALSKEAAAIAINRIFQTVLVPREPMNNAERAKEEEGKEEKEGGGDGEGGAAGEASEMSGANKLLNKFTPLTSEELEPLALTMSDFEKAVERVQPSAKREGFATVPDVTWEDVGSLGEVREELELSICEPILHPQKFSLLGLSAPTGVLLYGPPGCGKTLVAKAVARESGANFISVKGPELLNKFVGESERAVRQLFQRASASAPCVVFFDELDALCPKRGGEGGVASERVVNQLLTEMDGLNARRSVFVIAATNRPDMIDAAMLRPGRLDKLLYVRLPKHPERLAILRTIARKMPIDETVKLDEVAKDRRTEGFSGADLAALLREAAMSALREDLEKERREGRKGKEGKEEAASESRLSVQQKHIERALSCVLPSVSPKDEQRYELMASRLRQSRAHVNAEGEEAKS
ncbi:hypothetical protein GUITHDRAFT_81158 [Guillardia theta CCMP2712]|uniref:AAA+ ATPase domain-containing protein n=1 Tax=Guillardia theta (strain CCMP2712) TaxID=905079 RepID=L1IC19_GUITC|nr:hypothetical protein GUITHDRAFT_81158 [Guillardia theta CCMP2712]EKX33771.1 hypothetical protein GUITHDRAFT_81158 [Guillardia theta CCMP2712]|eukprot:XP_005820751.1 hypothetical protein GUITHDRAFT_81158 [Guillardia theta CCMP2712]